MHLLYPHLSSGYLGVQTEKATLNSSFYAEFFNNNDTIEKPIIFPQRVPRKEFFAEMLLLEGDSFTQSFKQFQANLKNNALRSYNSLLAQEENPRIFLNYVNLLLRYGLSDVICDMDYGTLSSRLEPSDFAEVELIQEISRHQLSHNHTNLNDLATKTLSDSALSTRVQIVILNYIVVAASRFNSVLPTRNA